MRRRPTALALASLLAATAAVVAWSVAPQAPAPAPRLGAEPVAASLAPETSA